MTMKLTSEQDKKMYAKAIGMDKAFADKVKASDKKMGMGMIKPFVW